MELEVSGDCWRNNVFSLQLDRVLVDMLHCFVFRHPQALQLDMEFDSTGAFLDNALMVQVAHHNPPMDNAEDPLWNEVAHSLQSVLRHPSTEDQRIALRWIDTHHYSGRVCRHRAQFILWRAKKNREQEEARGLGAKPSGFNILTGSLKDEVEKLMADVRGRLPSAFANEDREDETNSPIEIFQPPQELLEIDTNQAEAETAMLQQIQELQLEHYKKYHRWVEASFVTDSPQKPKPKQGGRSGLVSEDQVEDMPLDECSVQHIADLLDHLGISEHKPKFRRTSGKLLLHLKKEDLRERFGEDFEAADILWAHIQDNKASAPSKNRNTASRGGSEASSTTRRFYDAMRQPSSELQASRSGLQAYERDQRAVPNEKSMQDALSKGDLSAIKRAMNPNRPARPSAQQEFYDYSTSEDDSAMDAYGAAYMNSVNSDSTPANTPEKRRPVPTGPSAATAGASLRAGAPAASQPKAVRVDPAKATAPPSRAGRWQIMEYDDDEEDSSQTE